MKGSSVYPVFYLRGVESYVSYKTSIVIVKYVSTYVPPKASTSVLTDPVSKPANYLFSNTIMCFIAKKRPHRLRVKSIQLMNLRLVFF